MAFRSHISIFGHRGPRLFDILFIYLNYFYCRMKKKKWFDSRKTVLFPWLQQSHGENVELLVFYFSCFCSPLFYRCEGYAIKINSTFRIKLPYWNSYCARRRAFPEWILATNRNMFANLTLVWVAGSRACRHTGCRHFHPVIYRCRITNGRKRKIWAEELKWTLKLQHCIRGGSRTSICKCINNIDLCKIEYSALSSQHWAIHSQHTH